MVPMVKHTMIEPNVIDDYKCYINTCILVVLKFSSDFNSNLKNIRRNYDICKHIINVIISFHILYGLCCNSLYKAFKFYQQLYFLSSPLHGNPSSGVHLASIDKYSQVFISMMFFYHDNIFLVLIIVFNISVQKFILYI